MWLRENISKYITLFCGCTLKLISSMFVDGAELAKWLPNHPSMSYFLPDAQQLKPAWMLWFHLCGVDTSLVRTLDKTTSWIKSLPGCCTGQNCQPSSSVPSILTTSLTAFLPETKWSTWCGYHYCNFYIKSYAGGFQTSMDPRLFVLFYLCCTLGCNSRLHLKLLTRIVIFRFFSYFNFN